jgi:hypothetical protein
VRTVTRPDDSDSATTGSGTPAGGTNEMRDGYASTTSDTVP